MPKRIVICCDGTGNEIESDASNVLRLAHIAKKNGDQVVYYDPGVGTAGAPGNDTTFRQGMLKFLGMVSAVGLDQNIADAYRFLCNKYEEGDELFIFGFSRGAYTARCLAGLIHKVGIISPDHDNLIEYCQKLFSNFGNFDKSNGFRKIFGSQSAEIKFLGIWDTVRSVFRYDPRKFAIVAQPHPFTVKNPSVKKVRHAIAIDERRRFYRQLRWSTAANLDVKEVWFAGAHSDVGGSYPEGEGQLSKIALDWMLKEAVASGLEIDEEVRNKLLPTGACNNNGYCPADPMGRVHNSLVGGWWLLEFFPKTWREGGKGFTPFFPLGERRFIPEGSILHRSVEKKLKGDPTYRPKNLPKNYKVED